MKGWIKDAFSEYCEIIPGYAFDSSIFKSTGIPVIKIANIKAGYIDLNDNSTQFVDQQILKQLKSKYQIRKGDILVSLTGSHLTQPNSVVGRVGRFRDNNIALVNQRAAIILSKTKKSDQDFLYHLLSTDTLRKEISLMAQGAANQANISHNDIYRIKVFWPPLSIQRKIAGVLSAYDDLIENNKRRIAILEKMAEELYREWFVRLRFPGHEKVKIVKGVPEGWEVRKSCDVLDILGGGTPKTDIPSFWNGEIAFFTPKDSYQGIFTTETEKKITEQGLQSCNSTLFPKKTIFITARGTVGNIVLAGKPMAMNQSCYALVPKSNSHVYFHFLALRNSVSVIKGTSNSGVFDNIITDSFKQFGYLIPPKPFLDQFSTLMTPLFQQIDSQIQSNAILSTTRDRLLSRLMSGKIDVEELDIAFPKSMAEE